MKYDLTAFEDMVHHGYLRKTENEDLILYGYTDKCTFERAWSSIYTRNARGIIFEKKTGRLVAKPFPKFFNLGEMEEVNLLNLPKEPYRVFEKADGSLGILYYFKGKWNVATRGSLSSEQAIKGAEILKKYDTSFLHPSATYLVEIVYPENKIIVNYGSEEKLVMLSAYQNHTELECNIDSVFTAARSAGMPHAKEYQYTIEQMIELQKTLPKDEEGFVVRFDSGVRVKIKGHEYLKIAKILSQLSPLSAWEAMENGIVRKDYLSQVPEEFLKEFEPIVKTLQEQYTQVLLDINADAKRVAHIDIATKEGKKELGLLVQGNNDLKHPSAMFPFMMFQGQALNKYVMKQIRPTGNIL